MITTNEAQRRQARKRRDQARARAAELTEALAPENVVQPQPKARPTSFLGRYLRKRRAARAQQP